MCLAIPGKVIKIENGKVTVDYIGNVTRQAMTADQKVSVGDYVLVQMGLVVRVMNKTEYKQVMSAWTQTATKLSDPALTA